MEGRNGPDEFSVALSFTSCLLLLVAILLGGIVRSILWLLALLFLVITYYRLLSRNIARRRIENEWYLRRTQPFRRMIARMKTKRREKNLYAFFRCPGCGTVLRVPKGKGRVRITCKNCKYIFERKS